MTTIACDGKTMAADCQVTGGGQIVGYADKVCRSKDGRVFASCGPSDEGLRFAAYMDTGEEPNPPLTDDFAALILNQDGEVFWIGKTLKPVQWIVPAGLGSGGDIAIGAMLAGKSPQAAVSIACQRDVGSGGGMTWLGLESDMEAERRTALEEMTRLGEEFDAAAHLTPPETK